MKLTSCMIIVLCSIYYAHAVDDNITIDTQLGPVFGTNYLATGVWYFEGIPYTESTPLGDRRWTAMSKRTSNYETSPFTATQANMCPQAEGGVEDCLTLNIMSKNISGSKPVIVWIHGGAFVSGAGFKNNGVEFADKDTVFVSINYRLGVLGFLAHADIEAEDPNGATGGMFGIHDQIVALEWIQSNIADFGGDPSDVTVFGESAGGLSLCALVFSPLASGLLNRAIIMSGVCNGPWGPGTREQAEEVFATITQSVAELRELDVASIPLPANIPGPSEDGWVLSQSAETLFDITTINADVLMVGTTSLDALAFFFADLLPTNEAEVQDLVALYWGSDDESVYTELTNYYKAAEIPSAAFYNAYQIMWSMLSSDVCLVCPTFEFADQVLELGLADDVYNYQFLGSAEPYLAVHGADVPYAFASVAEDEELASLLNDVWVSIANSEPDAAIEPYTVADQKTTVFGGADGTHIKEGYASAYRYGVCDYWKQQTYALKASLCSASLQDSALFPVEPEVTSASDDKKSDTGSGSVVWWIVIPSVVVVIAVGAFCFYRARKEEEESASYRGM